MSVATFIEWFMAIFIAVTMTVSVVWCFVGIYKSFKED